MPCFLPFMLVGGEPVVFGEWVRNSLMHWFQAQSTWEAAYAVAVEVAAEEGGTPCVERFEDPPSAVTWLCELDLDVDVAGVALGTQFCPSPLMDGPDVRSQDAFRKVRELRARGFDVQLVWRNDLDQPYLAPEFVKG